MPAYDAAILLLIIMANLYFKPPLLYIVIAFVTYAVVRQFFVPLIVKSRAAKADADKGTK